MRITRALTAITIGLGLTLTGCGDDGDSDADATEFNDADIAFAQDMIPHHQQAVMMSGLVADQGKDPAVVELARQIEAAQAPEIETMQGWLADWDAEVSHEVGGHGEDGHSETGMMSQQDINRLTSASGRRFDRIFLRLMIAHHEGAITMAQTERSDGAFDAAIALAEEIESTQSDEIDRMEDLLGR